MKEEGRLVTSVDQVCRRQSTGKQHGGMVVWSELQAAGRNEWTNLVHMMIISTTYGQESLRKNEIALKVDTRV